METTFISEGKCAACGRRIRRGVNIMGNPLCRACFNELRELVRVIGPIWDKESGRARKQYD